MEYNACVSCALIGHNFPTVLQGDLSNSEVILQVNNACVSDNNERCHCQQVFDYNKHNVIMYQMSVVIN